jgi:hypothetical protein
MLMNRQFLSALGLAIVIHPLSVRAASLEEADKALGAGDIEFLELTASGRWYQFGQTPNPSSPPPFEVSRHVADIDYARGSGRVQITRKQVIEPGRARQAPAEQKVDQFVVGEDAWNFGIPNNSPPGTPSSAQPQPSAAEIWATPQGLPEGRPRPRGQRQAGRRGHRGLLHLGRKAPLGRRDQRQEPGREGAHLDRQPRAPEFVQALAGDAPMLGHPQGACPAAEGRPQPPSIPLALFRPAPLGFRVAVPPAAVG